MSRVETVAADRRPAHGGYPDPPRRGPNEPGPESHPLAVTRDRIMLDADFQAACQRYAHGNGSSAAIAGAALTAITGLGPTKGAAR